MSRIYLDHNAPSPLRPEAREGMSRALETTAGNPSSLHAWGRAARLLVESSRQEVARLVGSLPEEIVLTSGGTESNNLSVYGAAGRPAAAAGRVVASPIEPPSGVGPLGDLEHRGIEVAPVWPAPHAAS